MPLLRDDLLKPLPDGRGENLRYSPVYDKIKEARVEEDDAPQGEWERDRKKADFSVILKLAGDALAVQSKDLQLAVWYCEALIRREGLAAVAECLHFLDQLQEQFWDVLYPAVEGDDLRFRATPLRWFAGRCDDLLRHAPLTAQGLSWFKYKESREVGYEQGVRGDEKKQAQREEAVKEGKTTADEFDQDFDATPKKFYVAACDHITAAGEALGQLESSSGKYGKVVPSFGKLRDALEDVKVTVNVLLKKKREKEPDPLPVKEPVLSEGASEAAVRSTGVTPSAIMPQITSSDPEEVFSTVGRAAEILRQQDPSSVAPYLLTRSLRWGQMRSAGENPDSAFLVAPATDVRQNLKRLHNEGMWEQLLAAVESAIVAPCGRAWLDPHRYAWWACNQLSYVAVARAICSQVRALLADLPSLPNWTLADDTPVANPETRTWLEEHVMGRKGEMNGNHHGGAPMVVASVPDSNGVAEQFEIAMQLAQAGRLAEGIEAMMAQILPENSGRAKFLRQMQIAQLCLGAGHFPVALPILQDLFSEIQRHDLLQWESVNFLVPPLALLVQCIDQTNQYPEQRSQIYGLLCRLEPAVALQLQGQ